MTWSMHHHCVPPPGCCLPQPGWFFYPVYVPVHCAPSFCEEAPECECEELSVPQQIDVSGIATSSPALVGGHDDADLTVEYLVEAGAVAPTLTVTAVQPDGVTSTWSGAGMAAGFVSYEKFMTAVPGTQVTLAVNNVTARVRWCETICC